MTKVTLPRADIPFVGPDGLPSREWYRWASDTTQRIGGSLGTGSDDLALSQFEDAGIAEGHALMFAMQDEMRQAPMPPAAIAADEPHNEVAALREAIAVLSARLDALEQGQTQ